MLRGVSDWAFRGMYVKEICTTLGFVGDWVDLGFQEVYWKIDLVEVVGRGYLGDEHQVVIWRSRGVRHRDIEE